MISATVTGNVGKDATTREHDGRTVLNFTVASRRFEKGSELTDWVEVSFWGERAKKLASHIGKGSRVCVRGTLYVREYEHHCSRRSALTMRADDVELLGEHASYGEAPYHADYGAIRLAQRQALDGAVANAVGGDDVPL